MLKKFSFSLFILFFISSFIFAGVTITPARHEIVLNQGKNTKATVEFNIEAGILDEVVYITTKDWENSPNNLDIHVSSWLNVNVSSVIIKAHETKKIECNIDVPSSAGSGYVSAMVSFTTVKDGVSNIISLPIYATIVLPNSEEKASFDIDNFAYDFVDGKFVMIVDVINNSNFYIRPKIKYTLKKFRKTVFESEISNAAPVYAMNKRSFSSSSPEPGIIKKGKYLMRVEVEADGIIKAKMEDIKIEIKK